MWPRQLDGTLWFPFGGHTPFFCVHGCKGTIKQAQYKIIYYFFAERAYFRLISQVKIRIREQKAKNFLTFFERGFLFYLYLCMQNYDVRTT